LEGGDEVSHTPGPWIVTEDSYIRQAEGEKRLYIAALVDIPHRLEGKTEANARLIAAAPELLEALKVIANRLTKGPRHNGKSKVQQAITAVAEAAIAKATGGDL
jgi:hypothetical protein